MVNNLLAELPAVRVRRFHPLLASDRRCFLCLSPYRVGEVVRNFSCGHDFHSRCIVSWLMGKSCICPLDGNKITRDVKHSTLRDEQYCKEVNIPLHVNRLPLLDRRLELRRKSSSLHQHKGHRVVPPSPSCSGTKETQRSGHSRSSFLRVTSVELPVAVQLQATRPPTPSSGAARSWPVKPPSPIAAPHAELTCCRLQLSSRSTKKGL